MMDKFFGKNDIKTSEQGMYLKPVGKPEDNPFPSPYPETPFANWEELLIPQCNYGVPANTEEGVMDCGEPALWRVWWKPDESDSMFVCEEHARVIEESERNNK